jgi:adenine deaminase
VRECRPPARRRQSIAERALAESFLQVAFLPLAVIPHLKITDSGLVDADNFEFVRD